MVSPILSGMSVPLRRLLGFAARYRRQFIVGFACVVAATAIQLLSPLVLKYAIDDLTKGVTREKVRIYAVVLLALVVVGGVFRFLMRRIIIGASRAFANPAGQAVLANTATKLLLGCEDHDRAVSLGLEHARALVQ